MKKIILICSYLLFSLSIHGHTADDRSKDEKNSKKPSVCNQNKFNLLESERNDAIGDTFYDNLKLWKEFAEYHSQAKHKKLAVFMDGTRNDAEDSTNIRNLYRMAIKQSCNGEPIIPYYDKGVGTHTFDAAWGGAFGAGVNLNIRQAYQFLSHTYKKGDDIYIFGFSRGAFTARSLNGFIEFAGLLDGTSLTKTPTWWGAWAWENFTDTYLIIDKLFDEYLIANDGTVNFEENLRHKLKTIRTKIHQPYNSRIELEDLKFDDEVKVKIIAVFDTVPARAQLLPWYLRIFQPVPPIDDAPDNHRLDLYAQKGFHALSLDEQRNDFRLHRFNDNTNSILEEVWFPGSHSDIGGGYSETMQCQTEGERVIKKTEAEFLGMDKITREEYEANYKKNKNYLKGLSATPLNWILSKFKNENLFPEEVFKVTDGKPFFNECRTGLLHDQFFSDDESSINIFKRRGLFKRKPGRDDKIHASIQERIESEIKHPHPQLEPYKKYRPTNIKYDRQNPSSIDKNFYDLVETEISPN